MTLPISVIIPCYKQEQWVGKSIQSARDCDAAEIVVVYDNRTETLFDNAWLRNGVWEIKVGEGFRTGVCYSRNRAISISHNNILLPLDADDRLYPDALERMFAAWQPGTFVYGNYTEIAEDESIIREMQAPPPKLIFRKNLTYSTFLFDRADWLRVGGYDVDFEPLEEDYALQCALVNAGVKPIRLEGAPLYKRMIHSNSRTAKAMKYWQVTMQMCRDKFPGAFVV